MTELDEILEIIERRAAILETGKPHVLPELLHEAQLFRRAAELLRGRTWQPMETAPMDGTKIDVYHGGNVRSVRWTDAHMPNDFHWFIDRAGYVANPEAWRPHTTPNAGNQRPADDV